MMIDNDDDGACVYTSTGTGYRVPMRHTGHRRLNLTTVGWDKAGYNELWVLPPLDALDPRPDSVRGVSIITPPMKKMLRQRKAMQIARLLDGYLGMAKSAL